MGLTRDELIIKFGLGQLDDKTQQQVLENIAGAIASRLWNKVSEVLTDDDLSEVDKLIDQGQDEQAGQLIRSKFPNYDEFVATNENEVIEEIANGLKASEDALQQLQNQ